MTISPNASTPLHGRRVAVVLVHGLFSSEETWNDMAGLIAHDTSLAGANVYRFSYRSKVRTRTLTTVTPSLDDVADSLRTFLRYEVAEPELILVTHSQGGLIALRMLADKIIDSDEWQGPTVRLLLLYACPHFGSEFGRKVRRVFFSKHAQAKSLVPLDRPTLNSIRSVLQRMRVPSDPLADLRVIAVAGAADGIVTPDSARAFWPIVETVSGNHSSIVRPCSSTAASFLILRRQVLEVLTAPVTHLTPSEAITADSLWNELVHEVASRLHFTSWDAAYGGLVTTTHTLPSSVLTDLYEFAAWLLGRIFPDGHHEIRRSLDALRLVIVDLLNTFNDNHAEVADPESENPFVRVSPWYKTGGFNPRYSDDLANFLEHVNLLANLTFEMTRIANWFSDLVRSAIDPHFYVEEGALMLEVGPLAHGSTEIERPTFAPGELTPESLPYNDIESFRGATRFRAIAGDEEAAPVTVYHDETSTDDVERLLLERQMRILENELVVYRTWAQTSTRDALLAALRLGIESELVSEAGFRSPVWETSVHLRFVLQPDDRLSVQIESDDGGVMFVYVWEPATLSIDVFTSLDEAMRGLGVHLGAGLFLPTKNVKEAAEALQHAARYRSQTLNSGSDYLHHIVEFVDGWYITEGGVVSREHPYYFIDKTRLHEMDWEQHITNKGWDGIHVAMKVARALFPQDDGEHPSP